METKNSLNTSYTTTSKSEHAQESTSKIFWTTFAVAVEWLGNALIRCNHIWGIDYSVAENIRFKLYDDEDNAKEIVQSYITDCSEEDVVYLEKHFGLLFTYSELLECYILCVDHIGTAWDYVMIETDLKWAEAKQGMHKKDLMQKQSILTI